MKLAVVVVLLCVTSVLGYSVRAPGVIADDCDDSVCVGQCRCSSTSSPFALDQTPQLVSLIFDDAVTDLITTNYHIPLLAGRTNSDGSSIGATFFVPHEWSDYTRVNELYNLGYEIAVHSITKNPLVSYWAGASVEELLDEFGGQRTILNTFANIPEDDILGARTPNLELAANNTFRAYLQAGLLYDSSWPTFDNQPFFPYSLDYLSSQQCLIGECPNESFPGQWVAPIVNLIGPTGIQCNTLHGCGAVGTSDEISAWLQGEFDRVYATSRAPITLAISSAFYTISGGGFEGLIKFLDYLRTVDGVYLVTQKQVIDWARNPVPLEDFNAGVIERDTECVAITCPVLKGEETRYLRVCAPCPAVYPWLGNPLGLAS